MLSYSGRGLSLSQYMRATVESVGGRQILPALTSHLTHSEDREENLPQVIPHEKQYIPLHVTIPPQKQQLTHHSLSQSLFRKQLTFSNGIGVSHSYRFAHTDLQIPNFDSYRKKASRDPQKRNIDTIDERRSFVYLSAVTMGVTGVILSKYFIHNPILFLSPAADVLALAKVEVNVGDIPEGKNITVKWRGKPVFVRRRTAEEISRERAVDVSQLRDPETDEKRCPSGEWLVVIGVCTHLGCVPIPYQGEYGGYYCPCHGSHYDASGRIRKGPAPLNLEIPDYEFDGNTLTVG